LTVNDPQPNPECCDWNCRHHAARILHKSEATNPSGEQLGLHRIIEFVRAHRSEPVQQLADGLCRHTRDFAGAEAQQDDIAAIVLKTT